MTAVVLAVSHRDLDTPIPRCGFGIRAAWAAGMFRIGALGVPVLTVEGRGFLAMTGLA